MLLQGIGREFDTLMGYQIHQPKGIKMPKARVYQKDKIWNKVASKKLRIGSRKVGVSALHMSTKDLIEVLANPKKKKWHKHAVTVLRTRTNIATSI